MIDVETRARLIQEICQGLVGDAHRLPQVRETAHKYVCLAIRWDILHNKKGLAEILSGYSLQIAEMH